MLPKKTEKTFLILILVNFSLFGIIGYAIEKYRKPHSVLFVTPAGAVKFKHTLHNTNGSNDLECDSCHCVIKDPEGTRVENSSKNCRYCHYNEKIESSFCDSSETHKRCVGAKCVSCHDNKINECEFCHYR